jgi:hypothetical protein
VSTNFATNLHTDVDYKQAITLANIKFLIESKVTEQELRKRFWVMKQLLVRKFPSSVGTDRISGKVRFRPDIQLHFPVPVRQRNILADFCRKFLLF